MRQKVFCSDRLMHLEEFGSLQSLADEMSHGRK